jgi:hypothetical protein
MDSTGIGFLYMTQSRSKIQVFLIPDPGYDFNPWGAKNRAQLAGELGATKIRFF